MSPIHLPSTGLASFGRGVANKARRIRVNVKPPSDDVERDLKKHRKFSIKVNLSRRFSTMQDPDHVVGDENIHSFDPTSPASAPAPYEASPLTAPTAPHAASGIDDATKKAVDSVLYSDVRMDTPT